MSPITIEIETRQMQGTLCRVDVCRRELHLLVDDTLLICYVSPDCPVFANGERVRLRLLQPGDCVRVEFRMAGGDALATRVALVWPS